MALADDDLVQLPKIDQSQITRGKFIGSGAFGEVFEGIATGLDNTNDNNNVDNSSSTNVSKVAIKTLKKRESSIGKRNISTCLNKIGPVHSKFSISQKMKY